MTTKLIKKKPPVVRQYLPRTVDTSGIASRSIGQSSGDLPKCEFKCSYCGKMNDVSQDWDQIDCCECKRSLTRWFEESGRERIQGFFRLRGDETGLTICHEWTARQKRRVSSPTHTAQGWFRELAEGPDVDLNLDSLIELLQTLSESFGKWRNEMHRVRNNGNLWGSYLALSRDYFRHFAHLNNARFFAELNEAVLKEYEEYLARIDQHVSEVKKHLPTTKAEYMTVLMRHDTYAVLHHVSDIMRRKLTRSYYLDYLASIRQDRKVPVPVEVQKEEPIKKCPRCKKMNSKSALFCYHDGYQLAETA